MDFLNTLVGFLGDMGNWALSALQIIWKWAQNLVGKLKPIFNSVGKYFSAIWSHLRKIWTAIASIQHTAFWQELQKWYNRYKAWRDWYQKNILGPIQRVQQMIHNLYNVVFGPVLKTIDSIRVSLDTLLFWNKKLSAKIDAALFSLERKVMSPITYMLKRVNDLSSLYTAILTTQGRFDGTIFVSTVIQHYHDLRAVWGHGTLPAQVPGIKNPGPTLPELDQQFRQYARDRTGPIADEVNRLQGVFHQTLIDLGVTFG